MRNEVILRKLLGYTRKIRAYCEGCSYEAFAADSKLAEACVFNLSQMGELCRLVEPDFMEQHRQIPWHEMYGLRNRIVHDYEGVNLRLVWEIISEDLPALEQSLSHLL